MLHFCGNAHEVSAAARKLLPAAPTGRSAEKTTKILQNLVSRGHFAEKTAKNLQNRVPFGILQKKRRKFCKIISKRPFCGKIIDNSAKAGSGGDPKPVSAHIIAIFVRAKTSMAPVSPWVCGVRCGIMVEVREKGGIVPLRCLSIRGEPELGRPGSSSVAEMLETRERFVMHFPRGSCLRPPLCPDRKPVSDQKFRARPRPLRVGPSWRVAGAALP